MSAILTIRKKRKSIESLSIILFLIPFFSIFLYLLDAFIFNEQGERVFIYFFVFFVSLFPCSLLSLIGLQLSRLGIYRKTKRDEFIRITGNIFCGIGMAVGIMGWTLLSNALS